MTTRDGITSESGQKSVVELATRRDGAQAVYALMSASEVLAVAQVAPARPDPYPDEEPDFSLPPVLVMAAAAVPGHGYGQILLEALRGLVVPDLCHDGVLSAQGEKLVERAGIPLQQGKKPKALPEGKARALAAELVEFATLHQGRANVLGII